MFYGLFFREGKEIKDKVAGLRLEVPSVARISYARVACSIVSTPQDVETVLRAIRSLG